MTLKVLILGGTGEGRWLSERLLASGRYQTLLSFAGRTETLVRPDVPHRVGGFGGAEGLATFLREGGFDALVDTTHPYAARISENAVRAAEQTGTPLLRLERPVWTRQAGDRWRDVASVSEAASALGTTPRRVFLTVGRQEAPAFEIAPQHHYLIRAIDDFDIRLPHVEVLLARGPYDLASELALLRDERIELIVSKNAGTSATYPKIEAARQLGIEVVMVGRPLVPAAEQTETLDGVVAWLERLHGDSRSLRGE